MTGPAPEAAEAIYCGPLIIIRRDIQWGIHDG